MAELACQVRVSDRAWEYPAIREDAEKRLRYRLEKSDAHDIKIEEPVHVYVDGFLDEDGEWVWLEKPFWIWELNAVGETAAH